MNLITWTITYGDYNSQNMHFLEPLFLLFSSKRVVMNYSSLGSEKMVQLTVKQCVLVMTTYSLTGSYVAVRRRFQQKFPGHRPPT